MKIAGKKNCFSGFQTARAECEFNFERAQRPLTMQKEGDWISSGVLTDMATLGIVGTVHTKYAFL